MSEQIIATVTEIANALKISRTAVNNKKIANAWKAVTETGVDKFDIDEIPLTYKERKIIRAHFTKAKVIKLRAVPSSDQLQKEAEEKERLRLEARAQSLATFSRLPEWQQSGANAKVAIMQACDAFIDANRFCKTQGQDTFCHEYNLGRGDVAPWVRGEIHSLHPGTLRSWIAEEYELGMMGLVDLYGNRKGQSKIESYITGVDAEGKPIKPMATAILALMVDNPHIKPKHVNEYLRSTIGDAPFVSDKSVDRWMEAWKKEHPQQWDYITNPDNWKNKHLSAAGQMDEGVRYIPNKRWEIDATPADLLLTDNVRYKLIGLIDVGTRRPILQVTPTEKGLDNAKVVRRGILAWGVPATGIFITDQGNPYKSELFRRFLDGLNIEQEFCPAFSGDRKPFIERFFRTFSHDLLELLLGYCGHSVAERKAIESRKSFAQRLMDKKEVIEAKMTAEELQKFCDRWCADYNNRVHSTLGKSPNQVTAEWPHAIHRVTDERALDILLSPVAGDNGWRTVAKRGIKINGHWFIHGDFGVLSGKQVQALETEDIGRVIVNTMNEFGIMEFVGIAECPELTGISRAEVAAVTRARQKRVIAQANELKKQARKELKGQDIATAVLEHRERKAAASNVTHFPRPTIEYTTPGLQAAGEAAAILDNRKPQPTVSAEAVATRERIQAQAAAQKPVFDIPQGDREKYRLWCSLDGQTSGGVEVSEPEMRFYEAFRKTAAWRAFKGISEDIYSLRRN